VAGAEVGGLIDSFGLGVEQRRRREKKRKKKGKFLIIFFRRRRSKKKLSSLTSFISIHSPSKGTFS
jgi:hypothetical protein